MKIVEIVLIVLIIIGLVFKFLFLPGGDEMLMISITLLSMTYFVFAMLLLNQVGFRAALKGGLKNIPVGKLVAGGFGGIGLATMWIGILFKLLELTGADQELLLGSVISAVVLLAFVIFYFMYKDKASMYTAIRLSVTLVIGLFLMLTSSMTLIKWQYRNHPGYIEASEAYFENPRVDSLQQKRELEWYRARMPKDAFERYEKEHNAKRK